MKDSTLVLGAVAYDPKVVTIWDGFKEWFRAHGLAFDYVLYSQYERQVEALMSGEIDVAWNSPLAWLPGVLPPVALPAPAGLPRVRRRVRRRSRAGSYAARGCTAGKHAPLEHLRHPSHLFHPRFWPSRGKSGEHCSRRQRWRKPSLA